MELKFGANVSIQNVKVIRGRGVVVVVVVVDVVVVVVVVVVVEVVVVVVGCSAGQQYRTRASAH